MNTSLLEETYIHGQKPRTIVFDYISKVGFIINLIY